MIVFERGLGDSLGNLGGRLGHLQVRAAVSAGLDTAYRALASKTQLPGVRVTAARGSSLLGLPPAPCMFPSIMCFEKHCALCQ